MYRRIDTPLWEPIPRTVSRGNSRIFILYLYLIYIACHATFDPNLTIWKINLGKLSRIVDGWLEFFRSSVRFVWKIIYCALIFSSCNNFRGRIWNWRWEQNFYKIRNPKRISKIADKEWQYFTKIIRNFIIVAPFYNSLENKIYSTSCNNFFLVLLSRGRIWNWEQNFHKIRNPKRISKMANKEWQYFTKISWHFIIIIPFYNCFFRK